MASELNQQIDALDAQIKALQEQRTQLDAKRKAETIARLRREMEEIGLRPTDLAGSGTKRGQSKQPVRFKNGADTWTGRGPIPGWMKALEASGRKRDEFAVGA